jgi:EH domain-containing protein 1
VDWICGRDRPRTDPMFEALGPVDGKITGAGKCNEKSLKKKDQIILYNLSPTAAKSELIKSKLPNSILSKIWKLADVDCDGFLDIEEFALAMHLINVKVDGNELPNILPEHLIPPSKKIGE